ncbi:murein biosynthesis integral membrane protein MurJ [Geodermatophilaceae bacterium NBWT11]|nr:murein biosynthesis integral membrane protein MurJ [Geodermatophilaceae bacterium NBWT11]
MGAALPPPVAPPVLPPDHDPLALPPTDAPPVQPGPRSVEQHVPLRERFLPASEDTQLIPVLPPVPLVRQEDEDEDTGQVELREGRPGGSRGILRAAGTMAVASLVSRITGLLRTIVLAAVLGVALVNDTYTTVNTLPNIVYELLIGGVLTSVIVPLLVRAQEKDADGGVGYAQRLTTVAMVGLTVMTALAVLAAPLLTRAYGITGDPEQVALANWLARLLLVEIVFYGLGALATAILNARGVFGWPAWAPVLNNLVVMATAVLFALAGGPGDLTPVTITDTQVWLLGLGTTLGIAVQALVLVPQLRKVGVPFRPRWGLRGTGLREAGTLGLWVIAYVAVSQVGVLVSTRVANAASREGGLGPGALSIVSLLFQMPYGIIGVALLTALVPRMSRAASRQDVPGVAADLSLGLRLSATGLLPVTAFLVVLGPAVTTIAFSIGRTTPTDATAMGQALAWGAFGLLPMAVTLLQLRVFYAMKDARTPTLIQIAMVAVRVPLLFAVPAVVEPRHVVAGLMVVTSLTYVTGWVVGDLALRRRLGALRTGDAAASVLKLLAVSVVAGALGWGALTLTTGTEPGTFAESLATLLIGTVVIGTAVVVGVVLAKVPEVSGPVAAIRSRLGRARR